MFISESELFELTSNLPPEGDEVEGGVLDGDDDVDRLRGLAVERLPQPHGAALPVHAEEVPADGVLHAPALGVAAPEVVHLRASQCISAWIENAKEHTVYQEKC